MTRQEVAGLVDGLRERAPRVVDDCFENNKVNMGDIQRVLQLLLMERVSIRDLESILEVISDLAPRLRDNNGVIDHDSLAEFVRIQLKRAICTTIMSGENTLRVIMLEPRLEDLLIAGLRRSSTKKTIELAEDTRQSIISVILTELEKLVMAGHPPVLLTDPSIRRHMRIMLERSLPAVTVISTVEVPTDILLSGEGVVLTPAQLSQAAQA